MSESVDLLLTNGTVVAMDPGGNVFFDGAVAIRGRVIVAVGTTAALTEHYEATETRDCHGCAIIPGLINAHTHVPMSLLRGLAADVQLDVWLFGYMFPVESRYADADFSYTGTQLSCAEMIRGGITTFVDMYYFEDVVAEVAKEAGMRGVLGETIIGFPVADAKTPAESLAFTEKYLTRFRNDPLVVEAYLGKDEAERQRQESGGA